MTQASLIFLNPSVPKEDAPRLSRQCVAILERLRKGPMTNMDAVTELRVLNLTARVSEIRQSGHQVVATRVSGGLYRYELVRDAV